MCSYSAVSSDHKTKRCSLCFIAYKVFPVSFDLFTHIDFLTNGIILYHLLINSFMNDYLFASIFFQ